MKNEELQDLLMAAETAQKAEKHDEAERLANEILAALDHAAESTFDTHAFRANAILVLAVVAWRQGNYDASLDLARASLDLAEEYSLPEIKAKCWNTIGNVYNFLGSYDKALEYLGNALSAHEELGAKSGVARVTGNIGMVYVSLGSYDKALEFFSKALAAHEELGAKSSVSRVTGNIGMVYVSLGSYDKALEYFGKALATHEELVEKSSVARVTGNIGMVYSSLGSYDKALEYYGKALTAHEELGAKSAVALVTGNIGIVYSSLGSYDKALEYMGKALAVHEELGEKSGVARVTGSIGGVYRSLGLHDKALEYYSKALAAHEEIGEKSGVANDTGNIGSLYAERTNERYDAAKAEEFLLHAIEVSTEIGAKGLLVFQHKSLSELYEHEKRDTEALAHYKRYIGIEKEVNIEEVKKQDTIRQQQNEIERARAAAAAKLSATTALLHRVLPESIASRMIAGEEEIADYFPNVSILFADIAGFTPISAEMPAFIVVRFLNFVFKEFDRIIKKHGLEKIKTIGDGYMAVAGAPDKCEDHAERLAAAALEMLAPITIPEDIREFMPEGITLGIRIGLHTGSVVAGVIGDERFVWDIYSDAVNTAARMESHGEPDKIHVTQDFVRQLQNRFASTKNVTHGLIFEKRGEMEIKGKGMMKTYFLEQST